MKPITEIGKVWRNEHAQDSILFKNAVGSYDDFMSTPVAVQTLQYMKCYDSTTREALESSAYMPNVYRLLLREFRNREICFTTIDDFLDMLWSVIENHTPNFMERYGRYQQLLSLSDDDLLSLGTSITNVVENTNDQPDDPLKAPLKNVTNQQSSRTYSDKPSKIRGQIYGAQMAIIDDYLSHFDWLFVKLGSSSQYI